MNDGLVVALLVAGLSFGTPLALAAIGEAISERAGVLNIGVEGTMLLGAVMGFWAASESKSVGAGLVVGLATGAVVGLLYGIAAVWLQANQVVLGLALFITGVGLSSYIGDAAGLTGTRSPVRFEKVFSGPITDWPLVGPTVFGQDLVVYLSWLIAAAAAFYLYRTRFGLAVRAVGDDPWAADTIGIRVGLIRVVHVVIGSALAGMAGADVSLALIPAWAANLTAGSGWIAVALVILGGWRPWRILIAAYFFGAASRLAFALQVRGVDIPADVLNMLPYLLAFIALVVIAVTARRDTGAPSSLGRPYARPG